MKKNDLLFAGAAVAAALALFLLGKIFLFPQEGGVVSVYRGKELLFSCPLTEERREEIVSPDGGKNVLVIQNGEAYIEDADCPDKLCMRQGRIAKAGETLVCLPHRLSVTIEGGEGSAARGAGTDKNT